MSVEDMVDMIATTADHILPLVEEATVGVTEEGLGGTRHTEKDAWERATRSRVGHQRKVDLRHKGEVRDPIQ